MWYSPKISYSGFLVSYLSSVTKWHFTIQDPRSHTSCPQWGLFFFFFFFFFFVVVVVVVGPDRNSGSSDVCSCTLEVLHRVVDLLPNRCVSRPCFCSQILVGVTDPQTMFDRHRWYTAVAHQRVQYKRLWTYGVQERTLNNIYVYLTVPYLQTIARHMKGPKERCSLGLNTTCEFSG